MKIRKFQKKKQEKSNKNLNQEKTKIILNKVW